MNQVPQKVGLSYVKNQTPKELIKVCQKPYPKELIKVCQKPYPKELIKT